MSGKLQEYHKVWLSEHQHRTEEWLLGMLKDGFDIHHLDHDHNNNAGSNLVLIEHVDHIRLHGMSNSLGRLSKRLNPNVPKRRRPRMTKNQEKVVLDYVRQTYGFANNPVAGNHG